MKKNLEVVALVFAALTGCADAGDPDRWDDTKNNDAPGAGKLLPAESDESDGRLSSVSQPLFTFNGCTETEKGHLQVDLLPHARRIAIAARDYANTSPATWFGYWFGDPASSLARSNLSRIATMLNQSSSTNTTIECDRGTVYCQGALARFQGTDFVRLCPDYWSLSYEDRVYTLLHEAAHRYTPDNEDEDCSLGGGDNSQDACFYLARWNPTEAAEQVWAYEYYYRGWF